MYLKNPIFVTILLAMVLCVGTMHAQLVGTTDANVFLRGRYIEVGIDNIGAYGSDMDVPAGYHARGGAGYLLKLGFVADPAGDGWSVGTPNYMGDYFLPGGVPHEGWSLQVDGQANRAWRSSGTGTYTARAGSTLTLTGVNTGYVVDGSKVTGIWQGTMGNLEIEQRTSLDTNHYYFLVKVKIKNTGTTDANNVYYERTVDPENEYEVPGGSVNINKVIDFQPSGIIGDDNKCLVKTHGLNFPSLSYMGLGTIDCRARAFILSSGNYSPPALLNEYYDGTTSGWFNEGDASTVNSGCGIVFNLGTIAAGDSTSFAYAYILNEAYLDSAFAVLQPSFDAGGTQFGSRDTIYGCPGEEISLEVLGGEEYNWGSWLPSTGLEHPSGRSNIATVGDTPITYSIVGTTLYCPENDTIFITIYPLIPANPGNDTTVQMCSNVGVINLNTLLGGTPELGGTWTGIGVTPGGLLDPSGLGEGTFVYTYLTASGRCDDSSKLTLQVINDVNIDFEYTIIPGCEGDSVQFTHNTPNLIEFRWNFGDGSPHNTTDTSPVHFYEEQGLYSVWFIAMNNEGCVDSQVVFVDTRHPLEAQFDMSNDSICQTEMNTVNFYDNSVGNIVSWQWDFGDGHSSNLKNPSHSYLESGTFIVRLIVTDNVPCVDTMYDTIFVDATPDLTLESNIDSICQGERVLFNIDYIPSTENVIWNFGDGSIVHDNINEKTHSYAEAGMYVVTVTTQHPVCNDYSMVDTIIVKPHPQINLGADTALCMNGEPIFLNATALVDNPPGTYYYWNTGDSTAVLKITAPGTYRVTANLDGCITQDEIIVRKDCYIDIPNSFTPNGDGDNDYFFPRQWLSEGVVDFQMVIYNRWGEKIFETNNPTGRGWDGKYNGKNQPMGVYIYQISVRYKNQTADKYTGNVTLIR